MNKKKEVIKWTNIESFISYFFYTTEYTITALEKTLYKIKNPDKMRR
jgi:hypothetical protein